MLCLMYNFRKDSREKWNQLRRSRVFHLHFYKSKWTKFYRHLIKLYLTAGTLLSIICQMSPQHLIHTRLIKWVFPRRRKQRLEALKVSSRFPLLMCEEVPNEAIVPVFQIRKPPSPFVLWSSPTWVRRWASEKSPLSLEQVDFKRKKFSVIKDLNPDC